MTYNYALATFQERLADFQKADCASQADQYSMDRLVEVSDTLSALYGALDNLYTASNSLINTMYKECNYH